MKATAIAPSNIAFIKFFGKTDEKLRLPENSSLSMCLSNATTTTTVEFSKTYKTDLIKMINGEFNELERERILQHLSRLRKIAKSNHFAKVVTFNNFPKSSGIASSASGFAALTKAGVASLNLQLTEKKLSILARLASGSACRSIPNGFVEWKKGDTHESSYAYSLYPADYWDIRDMVIVLKKDPKIVTTSDAHRLASTSPFYKERIRQINDKIIEIKHALERKNWTLFGEICEEEALNMHAVMMTMTPSLLYLTSETISWIREVWKWRKEGLEVYFTIDAGPNLHILCEGRNQQKLLTKIKALSTNPHIIVNKPGYGARLISEHLF